MNRRLLTLLILCLPLARLLAQDQAPAFEFTTPKHKPVKSLYKTITFLDSRRDTSCIGVLDSSRKKIVRLILRSPVQPQLDNILTALTDDRAGDGELLFQLRRFSFAEQAMTRYCYLIATLYKKAGDRYTRLADLDTVMSINTPGKIKEALGDLGNEIVDKFIAKSIALAPAGSDSYSLAEIQQMDAIEKKHLPLYTAAAYVNGFYSRFASFANQTPDLKGEVKTNDSGKITDIRIDDPKWKKTREHIYAVVYKGTPYVVTHYGCYPLEKIGEDFYFTGDLRVNATSGELAGSQLALGLVGRSLVASAGNRSTYQVVIDHHNGEFIHLMVLDMDPK